MKLAVAVVVAAAACGDNFAAPPDPFCDGWHQFGGSPSHRNASCAAGQPLERILADVVIDPLVSAEDNNGLGDLFVHYQAPLIDGDSVFMLAKSGTYTPCVPTTDPTMLCNQPADEHRFESQIWNEVGYAWQRGALVQQWTYESDWKPPGFEIVFHPAIAGNMVAIPAASGGLDEVDEATGALVRHVAPFGDDPDTYVVSALAVDRDNIYYTAIHLSLDPASDESPTAWLVAVAADGTARTADFASLVKGAPATCFSSYAAEQIVPPFPWPPLDAHGTPLSPPSFPCGPQLPGYSAAPGIAYDGTIYVVSSAGGTSYSYLTSINPGDLSTNWSASLRDRLHDGCGVDIPFANNAVLGQPYCADGAPAGIDPNTGMFPAASVDFGSTSSPVPLANGDVLYGSLTSYNEERGHLLRFDDHGGFVASYDFGWDLTPAVISAPTGERIIVKDNHYGDGGPEPGPFWLTALDDTLHTIWQFQNTEGNSCVRQPDGTLSCTADHPHGFEWCVNAPAVDANGVTYANSEDGNLYAITPNGELRDRLFLNAALGASYTPVSIDHLGRIYSLNNGHLFVVGAE